MNQDRVEEFMSEEYDRNADLFKQVLVFAEDKEYQFENAVTKEEGSDVGVVLNVVICDLATDEWSVVVFAPGKWDRYKVK